MNILTFSRHLSESSIKKPQFLQISSTWVHTMRHIALQQCFAGRKAFLARYAQWWKNKKVFLQKKKTARLKKGTVFHCGA